MKTITENYEKINDNSIGLGIFTILNRAHRSSGKNYNKVRHFGIIPNERFWVDKTKNISCVVYPRHSEITKCYYWGNRYITEKTAKKRLEFF